MPPNRCASCHRRTRNCANVDDKKSIPNERVCHRNRRDRPILTDGEFGTMPLTGVGERFPFPPLSTQYGRYECPTGRYGCPPGHYGKQEVSFQKEVPTLE